MPTVEEAARMNVADLLAWQAPHIDGSSSLAAGRRLGGEQLRTEQKRILAEAEAAGRAAGLAAAQKEIEPRLRQLDEQLTTLRNVLDALSRPLAQVDSAVHEQIALLAMHLARGLVRRELRADPTQVIAMVRDTVGLLPASSMGVRVALHPEDAALVRERLTVAGPGPAWSIIDDPALARGDCRVFTDHALIDARVETRLKEALAALLGDERTAPRSGEET